MPRDHVIKVLPSGLVHVTGGKWTTYRNMAKHTVNKAVRTTGLKFKRCKTKHLRIHGWTENNTDDHLSTYGTDACAITQMMNENSSLSEKIHPSYPYAKAEILWIIENEMAFTIEDILARRIRLLFLDAQAAMESAPVVAAMLAAHYGMNKVWEKEQLDAFSKLAQGYLPHVQTKKLT